MIVDDGGVQGQEGWGIRPAPVEPLPEVVLTATRRQRLATAGSAFVGIIVANVVIGAPLRVAVTHSLPWLDAFRGEILSGLLTGTILAILLFVFSGSQQVRVSSKGIASVQMFRYTAVWWSDVVSFEVREKRGIRSIWLNGRYGTMKLSGPWSGPGPFADRDFEAKLATIRSWHHSCTPQAAPPATHPAPDRPSLPPRSY